MNDNEHLLWSDKGFAFTATAADVMARWAETMRFQNYVPVWVVTVIKNELSASLGGDNRLFQDIDVEDRVKDIRFYWRAREHDLKVLRNYCVHTEEGQGSSLVPLTSEQLRLRPPPSSTVTVPE